MSVLERQQEAGYATRSPVINDFSLVVATANGTGSQTANLTLLRSFFKLGIPVHGKNIFPSNIQGLPTWYHIRVSHKGYIARKTSEILVAFNPATAAEDVRELPAGGVCVYNADLKNLPQRDDLIYYPVPVNELIAGVEVPVKRKPYIANMAYVGVLAWMLALPLEVVEEALGAQFGYRQKLIESNLQVVRRAHEWATQNLRKQDPYRLEPMNKTEGLIIMTGNEAGALGAVFGGVSVAAWYPITPSTSFMDALREFLPKLRKDPGGHPTYAVIQAEDELAAAGIVMGAGWAGARALTATSGPGISLMAEFVSYGYFAEIPAVIWDIQRVGPSTGLPTRTSQGDVSFAYTLGHGDTKHPVLFPSSIEECFEFGWKSLDLAEQLQTPVFVLSDLDLGMNNWMGRPFDYPDRPLERGKVLDAAQLEALGGFARYKDVDGDGIPYRTLPGTPHPLAAYFTRGSGHNEQAQYSERAQDYERLMARLAHKFTTARSLVPEPAVELHPSAKVGIIAYGTTRYAIEEARDRLARQLPTSFLRLRALPMGQAVREFVAAHERVYVIELNRDGQLHSILQNEMPEYAARLFSVAHLDGLPLTAEWVQKRLLQEEARLR
ncbi:MAG: 2-oxoacid:acceptor oxidoreductase subunit alpha [Meiothermus sp.]|uniref:2-oxoacid:acceptor oxidoreductase subunit alpha n=1 Tax=Meiothermus sp. TaxID=1955249 RepID=UPI0025D14DCF|nr:2-oxoacid:acceptor oxidoreductase subunit alpha [Meiothermus sp.]MCS7067140.1 2-oxoacid:acceptor oxidoreductase subunit alpha [Meiothermus sp.]MCX7601347.1 2-oxoacid:acceptor oxidoreductase subunit alpha [Meiothermus sp.]MDW8426551.1 2-oxoacid:acceptor oxidoreductase subunit alpha [Meiothermus sp.]